MRPLERPFAHLVGVSVRRLENSNEEDAIFVIRLGLHLLLTFVFLTGSAYFALTVAFSQTQTEWISFPALFIALIIGLLLLFVDIYIIHSSWYDQGRQELDSVRADKRFARKRLPVATKLIFRLAISIFVSTTIASFIDLKIFSSEIDSILDSKFSIANAPIKAKIRADIDREIEERARNISSAQTHLSKVQEQISGLQQGSSLATGLDKQISLLSERLSALDNLISNRRREEHEYRLEATCEISGRVCVNNITGRKTTGKAGCNIECKTALRFADDAEKSIKTLTSDRNNLSTDFDKLSNQRAEIQTKIPKSDEALRALEKNEKESRDKIFNMTEERENLLASIEKQVEERFSQNKSAIPRANGILAKFVGFKDYLYQNPSALLPFLIITIVTILLEMSAVISKIWFSPKNVYSVKTASDYDESVRMELFKNHPSLDIQVKWAELTAEIAKLQNDFDTMKNGSKRM